jgi:hypothetical protein
MANCHCEEGVSLTKQSLFVWQSLHNWNRWIPEHETYFSEKMRYSMTYPLSKDVTAGETTLASQYNHLRADAIRFGGEEGLTATIQELLYQHCSSIQLSGNETTLTLTASAANPCAMMIDGQPAVMKTSLTHEINAAEFPASAVLWIFAVKSANSAGFTLSVSASSSEDTGKKLIGRFYWNGKKIVSHTVTDFASNKILSSLQKPEICQGRLTLASGEPFPSADIPSQDTLYFTPCLGNKISLFSEENGWLMCPFTQLSLPLSGLQPEYCYDIFVGFNTYGSIGLSAVEWTGLTTRSEALSYQDGIPVLASAKKWRYVGTIGISSEGYSRDTLSDRNIWNLYHPFKRPLRKLCAIPSAPNPVQNAWVPYAADNGLFVSAVIGLDFADLTLTGMGFSNLINSNCSMLGIGIDTDTANFSSNTNAAELSAFEFTAGSLKTVLQNRLSGRMVGKHRYHLITYTLNDTHTFQGTYYPQAAVGLSGYVLG